MISKKHIVDLADRYETASFLLNDPSKFMHSYLPSAGGTVEDAEVVAFISSSLAFGRRDQILSHVQRILDLISGDSKSPVQWIMDGGFKKHFNGKNGSFYRMYSYSDICVLLGYLQRFLKEKGSLGCYFKERWLEAQKNVPESSSLYLHQVVSAAFEGKCALVSSSPHTAAKKINMFLRWMVRDKSPVDLGLWPWYDKNRLLVPLDTHVMQESVEFGFIKKSSSGKIPGATLKAAVELSQIMEDYFPGDRARGDFALFGLGVNRKD